jgi:short-subunit dehydrogenase involved in D-alanine esterification of teichoic acids
VNVSSGLALLPKRTSPVYGATKAALHSFTISLRWQLEATHVHVMEVLPPVVRTAMTEGRNAGAIGPEAVAVSLIQGLRANTEEVLVGQSRLFAWVIRVAPWLARRILQTQ